MNPDNEKILGMVLAIMFFLSFLSGGLWGLLNGIKIVYLGQASQSWPSVEGKILSSEIKTGHGKHGSQYGSRIIYQYVIDGESYSSRRVIFGDYTSGSPYHAQTIIRRYPVGSDVIVYYDPRNPKVSVLERGFSRGAYICFAAGGVFSLIGFIGIYGLVRNIINRKRK